MPQPAPDSEDPTDPSGDQDPPPPPDLPPDMTPESSSPPELVSAPAEVEPDAPRFSLAPIRDNDEWRSIPHIDAAAAFAAATNTLSIRQLRRTLARDVVYTSDWSKRQFTGRRLVVEWFDICFLRMSLDRLLAYRSQVVVTPDGLAGVLTGFAKNPSELALTQFETNPNGKITRLSVTTDFVRQALRETGYCPPEG